MLNQHMAILLLCGACLTLFSSHADYPSAGLDRYSYQNMAPEVYNATPQYFEPVSGDFPSSEPQLSMLDIYGGYPDHNFNPPPKVTKPWQIRLGLSNAVSYLQRTNLKKRVASHGANVTNQQLVTTAHSLLNWNGSYTPEAMRNSFHLKRLHPDKQAKSKFTGYYTPIISAQLHPDKKYRYPIYRLPTSNQRQLSRAQIASGSLAGKGFEIAWTNDPVGLFYVQIQGSGILQLPNGKRKSLKFDGSNEKRFRSIARYMKNKGLLGSNPSRLAVKQWLDKHPEKMDEILNINPRYIYFRLNTDGKIRTASGAMVVTGHTVAVDTNYIPFGAVVLAEVPIINTLGHVVDHQWRLLFPQDRGDAIEGAGRMDIYTGIGEVAREKANSLTGYGRAYLLLPKSRYIDAARA
jgi:membrane-bound lytic murein transglycosylase A